MASKNRNNNFNGVIFPTPNKNIRIVIKFREDAQIRYRSGKFSSLSGLNVSPISDLLLKNYTVLQIRRMFEETEEYLNTEYKIFKSKTNIDLPMLSTYYVVETKDIDQANKICDELKKFDFVAETYIETPTLPAVYDEPYRKLSIEPKSSTIDYSTLQGYLNASPEGVDAYYSWRFTGGRGDRVRVIDIEGAWNYSHEDLIMNQGGIVGGTPNNDLSWENHGTAVQGEIAGDSNIFGITGISPDTTFSSISIFPENSNSPAKAIKTAATKLNRGDIILIELHRQGPNWDGRSQFGFIPIEWWSADFDAIRYATLKGIIVVAAAGNGSQDLDNQVYQGRFNRSNRDSGAILVGAGAPPSGNHGTDRSRLEFSNYGMILDAQGWGREVVTTGYGDLQGGSDKNRWYTRSFSGTSSASPIVVGVIACLQSIQKARDLEPLKYDQIREILRSTGSPQTTTNGRPKSQRIGNRPDLKAALRELF